MRLRFTLRHYLILQICLAVLLLATTATPAFATVKWLSTVVPAQQAKSNWCWAASGEMIEKHFGGTLSQWANVDYIYHNQNYPNYTASLNQTNQAINHFQTKRTGMTISSGLTFLSVKYQINCGGPMAAGWGYYSGGGHMTVVRGYDDDTATRYVYWVNPADGAGHKNTYNWFYDDGVHRWVESIYFYQ